MLHTPGSQCPGTRKRLSSLSPTEVSYGVVAPVSTLPRGGGCRKSVGKKLGESKPSIFWKQGHFAWVSLHSFGHFPPPIFAHPFFSILPGGVRTKKTPKEKQVPPLQEGWDQGFSIWSISFMQLSEKPVIMTRV